MTELSNCCKRPVIVDSSNEGTSCFVCSQCKKACDLFCEEMISLEIEVNKCWHCNRIAEFIKWHKYYNPCCSSLGNFIEKEEYERLKRLDENRKKEIEKIKEKLHLSIVNRFKINVGIYNFVLELLQSLDK